eukprot:jgi/Chrzof1/14802/Cz09g16210.t1
MVALSARASTVSNVAAEQALQLSPLETAHVHAVLQSTIDKLALVGVINVDPRLQAQELTQSVGDDITRMISEQKEHEQRFQALIAAQPALRNLPNKAKLRENQAEVQHVSEALRAATRQLCRSLKDNPNVTDNMAKVATERQALQSLLNSCLANLQERQCIQPIIDVVMTTEQAEIEMRETIEAERAATSAVKTLRAELRDEKVAHEEQMRERRQDLVLLKDELRTEKMMVAVDARYHGKDSAATNQCMRRLERTQLEEMGRELELLRQQIDIERSVHATTVEFLSSKVGDLQSQAASWQSKRDEDGHTKDRELEMLHNMIQKEHERRREVTAQLQEEMALKDQRDAAEKEAAEEREMADMIADKKLKAAIKIQSAYRGWKTRKDIKAGGKGKKGKGNGKGKKKK